MKDPSKRATHDEGSRQKKNYFIISSTGNNNK